MDYKLACRQLMHALLDESLTRELCGLAQHYFDRFLERWDESEPSESSIWPSRYGALMTALDNQADLYEMLPESEAVVNHWRRLQISEHLTG